MTTLKQVGILAHPLRPPTGPVADEIAGQLERLGLATWVCKEWTEADVATDVRRSDLVVAIGGDGAMLRAARVCAPFDVPVLGVNMGQLGFLTEINDPKNSASYFERLLAEDYWIETRMMIEAQLVRGSKIAARAEALNDVVISRQVVTSILQVDMYIDQAWATTYSADALIIATATGSTAYALATGGPILPPDLRNILVLPVAPHLSMDRAIVLAEGATVDAVPVSTRRDPIIVSVDGQILWHLETGDRISVRASEYLSRFVRMRSHNYFYRSLLDRLEPRIKKPPSRPPLWLDDLQTDREKS